MIKVKFTPALNRFQSDLKPIEVEGSTVKEVKNTSTTILIMFIIVNLF